MKKVLSLSFLLPLLLLIFTSSAPLIYADDDVQCHDYTNSVTLFPTDPTTYQVFGKLCSQGVLEGKTVQFLVHGLTYDHNYWDWPVSPEKYSYVRKATDEGYATFTIDRIGIGNSDHPLSTSVTLESNAYVDHQLVQYLRSGSIGGISFSKIILVGHSFGSDISLFEQATYSDTNGLILSGFTHDLNPAFLAVAFNNFYPTSFEPKFATSNFPGTYLTTIPGTRASLFYNVSDATPDAIAVDEQLKQTVTDGEFNTINDDRAPSLSQSVHVPVLIALGQKDFLYCNPNANLSCEDSSAILQREQADFSPQACLEAFVLPNSGHVINLHKNAHDWFEAANMWANKRIGTLNNPPSQPCQN